MTTEGTMEIYVCPPRGGVSLDMDQHDLRKVIGTVNRLGLEGKEVTSVDFEKSSTPYTTGGSVTARINYKNTKGERNDH